MRERPAAALGPHRPRTPRRPGCRSRCRRRRCARGSARRARARCGAHHARRGASPRSPRRAGSRTATRRPSAAGSSGSPDPCRSDAPGKYEQTARSSVSLPGPGHAPRADGARWSPDPVAAATLTCQKSGPSRTTRHCRGVDMVAHHVGRDRAPGESRHAGGTALHKSIDAAPRMGHRPVGSFRTMVSPLSSTSSSIIVTGTVVVVIVIVGMDAGRKDEDSPKGPRWQCLAAPFGPVALRH